MPDETPAPKKRAPIKPKDKTVKPPAEEQPKPPLSLQAQSAAKLLESQAKAEAKPPDTQATTNAPEQKPLSQVAPASAAKEQTVIALPSMKEEPPKEVKPAAAPIPQEANQNKPPPKDDFSDLISQPIKEAWEYLRINYKRYYIELLKIGLIRLLMAVAMIILFGLVIFGMVAVSTSVQFMGSYLLIIGVIIIIALFGYLVLLWMVDTINLTALVLTDNEFNKKPFNIGDAFNSIKGRSFRYVIVDTVSRIILLIPGLIVLCLPAIFLSSPNGLAIATLGFMVTYMLFLLYCWIVFIAYNFLLQFWPYGFIVEGLPVVESMKKSVRLARSRFFETIVFDVVLWVLLMVASIPLFFFLLFAYIFLIIASLLAIIPIVGIVLFLVIALVLVLASLLFTTIVEAVSRPCQYLYWKKINIK